MINEAISIGRSHANRAAMFRHLFLALFLIGLALPSLALAVPTSADAAANCHDRMPIETPQHHSGGDKGKAAVHSCIGCVASAAPVVAIEPLPIPALLPPARPLTALIGANAPPSTPPPRT